MPTYIILYSYSLWEDNFWQDNEYITRPNSRRQEGLHPKPNLEIQQNSSTLSSSPLPYCSLSLTSPAQNHFRFVLKTIKQYAPFGTWPLFYKVQRGFQKTERDSRLVEEIGEGYFCPECGRHSFLNFMPGGWSCDFESKPVVSSSTLIFSSALRVW